MGLKKGCYTAAAVLVLFTGLSANAQHRYKVTIKNGGVMGVSPGAIYVVDGNEPLSAVGKSASAGFTQICQTGNTSLRLEELKANPLVRYSTSTSAPIAPGAETSFEIDLRDRQSLHFEAMYGRTKDLCAVIDIPAEQLRDLRANFSNVVIGRDKVLASGRFTDPIASADADSLCQSSSNAISCLRALSFDASGPIKFFVGYLPSLLTYLEEKYSAAEVQTLLVPTAGAVEFTVELVRAQIPRDNTLPIEVRSPNLRGGQNSNQQR